MKAQMSNEERIALADVIINNEGSLEDVRDQVRAFWTALMYQPEHGEGG
jgi:dephospho-CoA kinase